jgi:hypothetical protein
VLPLTHAPAWVVVSVVLVAGVIYGSLATFGPPMPVPMYFDKVQHGFVYAFLAVWFTGLVARGNFWKVALGLALLGLSLELLQHAMRAGRFGDPWDMVANVLGIAAGVAIGAWLTGGWALKVDAWLTRN